MTLRVGFAVKAATPDAKDFRLADAGRFARSTSGAVRAGVLPAHTGTLFAGNGSDRTITIGAFAAVTTRGAAYGALPVANDGTVVSPAFDPAPSSNSRIDVLYLIHRDSVDASDVTNVPEWGIAKGTAAGSPSAPAVPSGAVPFANVLIAAGDSVSNDFEITDSYPFTAAEGGTVLLRNAAEQTAWTPHDGSRAFRIDLDADVVRVDGAWVRPVAGGMTTLVGDANGYVTVTHGLGKTPLAVVATIADDTPTIGERLKVNTSDFTSTTFKARFYRMDTLGPYAANAVKFSWVAVAL